MGEQDRIRPIYSTRADDPDLTDAIEAFVIGLAERIDHLQDAEGDGRLSRLAELAADLARESATLGYEGLGDIARAVAEAARNRKADGARSQVTELTDVAQRVRLGHPGAF